MRTHGEAHHKEHAHESPVKLGLIGGEINFRGVGWVPLSADSRVSCLMRQRPVSNPESNYFGFREVHRSILIHCIISYIITHIFIIHFNRRVM